MAEDFFAQMKQAVSLGVDAVNQGVSELNTSIGRRLEIGRHQIHIEGLNRQIREIMAQLGGTVYAGWKENTLDADDVRTRCAAIAGLEAQKQALEDRIARLRSEEAAGEPDAAAEARPVCPACGAEPCQGAAFCHICGAGLGK